MEQPSKNRGLVSVSNEEVHWNSGTINIIDVILLSTKGSEIRVVRLHQDPQGLEDVE